MADRYTCDVGTFQATMSKILFDVQNGVDGAASRAVSKNVRWGAKELRTSDLTPVRKTGKFSDGWYKSGFASSTKNRMHGAYGVIYNKKAPGLVHLLEKGHATPAGGRVAARVHVAPIAEQTFERFWEDIQEQVGGAL